MDPFVVDEASPKIRQAPATFNERYEVVCVLKSGGMGTVYEVRDRTLRRKAALKTIRPHLVNDADLRRRFCLEAEAASKITSENIVTIFDFGVDEKSNMPFLVMEYLEGEDLGDVLARDKKLAADNVVDYLWQTSLALDRAHDAGIVHRDLKPENLFLTTRSDGAPLIKILDFGVSKFITESAAVKTTRVAGTPMYMSPEQIEGSGNIDRRADVYALGHIAFTLLAGRAYHDIEPGPKAGLRVLLNRIAVAVSEKATSRAERVGASLPVAFDSWFARATAREPSERFGKASELVCKLAEALGVSLPSHDSKRAHAPRPTSHFVRSASIGLLVLIAIAAGVLTLIHRGSSRPAPSNSSSSASSVNGIASSRGLQTYSVGATQAPDGISEPPTVPGLASSTPANNRNSQGNSPPSRSGMSSQSVPHDGKLLDPTNDRN